MTQNIWIITGWLVLSAAAGAASFDCGKASTEVEKLIFSDSKLSKLDESLGTVYQRALSRADVKQQAIDGQREWLKHVRNACRDVECIRDVYETRIKELGILSSFGIVLSSVPRSAPALSDNGKEAESRVLGQDVQVSTGEKDRVNMQVAQIDCAISLPSNYQASSVQNRLALLLERSKLKFEQKQFECAIQALEQANNLVLSVDEGFERASLGFEIKDVALEAIYQGGLGISELERRVVFAAVQSIESSGEMIKAAGDDERFNDAVFLARVSDYYSDRDRRVDFRFIDLMMLKVSFSLSPDRQWADASRMKIFFFQNYRESFLSEAAELWKDNGGSMPVIYKHDLELALYQSTYHHVVNKYNLISLDRANEDLDALTQMITLFKGEELSWPVYRYMAEIYWRLGDNGRAHEYLEKSHDLARGGRASFWLMKSLCKPILSITGRRISDNCPFGIYDAGEMSTLLDEVEALADTDSFIKNKIENVYFYRKKVMKSSSQ